MAALMVEVREALKTYARSAHFLAVLVMLPFAMVGVGALLLFELLAQVWRETGE